MSVTPNGAHPHWHNLVTENLPLVPPIVQIVARYAPNHVDRQELAQAGTLGLIDAARRYTQTGTVPFAAYAVLRIRGAILDAMRRDDWAPRGVRAQMRDVQNAHDRLRAALNREPSHQEIAAALGWDVSHVQRVLADVNRSQLHVLAATPSGEYAATHASWQLEPDSPEQQVINSEQRAALTWALSFLPDDLKQVIRLRFVHGQNLIRIADQLGITDARVAQLVKEALNMLRALLKEYDSGIPPVAPKAAGALRRAKVVDMAREVRLGTRGDGTSLHRTITHDGPNSPRL